MVNDVEAQTGAAKPQTGIIAISGPAGVGKTALAIRAAHDLAAHYTDGQLFANLRGEDHEPIEPFEVLGRFLRSLGVGGLAMPDTVEGRVDLYRSILASRRVLVVLDNAAGDDQASPLIPGPSCGVIMTSRRRLGATISASVMGLDVLEPDDAADLLSTLAGASRIAAEPDEVAQLVHLCGRLPLALRVAGARLAAKPHWTISKLTAMLADEHGRLDQLAYEHLDVRASIGLSYAGLSVQARQLLRRLGNVDLPDVTIWSAAALLDVPANAAEVVLEQLFDAQLLDVAGRDIAGYPRYRLHDLVRLYACEKAKVEEDSHQLADARGRVYSCCLTIVEAQYRQLNGGDYRNIRGSAARWSPGERYIESVLSQPLWWFETNRHSVISVVRQAARDGQVGLCWEIACTAAPLFQMGLHLPELQGVLEVALAATSMTDNLRARGAILYRLGGNATDYHDYDIAKGHFQLAAELLRQSEDDHGSAMMTALVAMVERFQGHNEQALGLYGDALPRLRASNDLGSVAWVLRGIGQIHLTQDDLKTAEQCFTESLEIYRTIGARQCVAQVMFWYSMLRLGQEQYQDALDGFSDSLEACRFLRDRAGEGQCLRGIGICYQRMGDIDSARNALQEALHVARQPRPSILEEWIRQSLAELPAQPVRGRGSGEPARNSKDP